MFERAKHKEWNNICQSLNLETSLSSQWRRLRWLYNGGTSPKRPLIISAKAMADESMSLFSKRSHPSSLKFTTRITVEALKEFRTNVVEKGIQTADPDTDIPFTMSELEAALDVHKNSSPGKDNITYIMLTHLGEHAKLWLLNILNISLANQSLYPQWKVFPHVPVPKSTPGEYRPIALLSCIDKVLERMVLARLKFKTGPLHNFLMGGSQGKGTADAIATVISMASDAKHRRTSNKNLAIKQCLAVFIDFEKAFELADPLAILHILASDKGIKGNLLGWLQDFLTGRQGYTTVQGIKSDILPLFQGTPQGSVLSPFLFNILMDKLLVCLEKQLGKELMDKIVTMAYADDLVLISNHAHSQLILSKALHLMERFSAILGLQINAGKTKAMAWNNSQFFPPQSFNIYGEPVEWVRSFKYLGVVLDDNLSFLQHASHVCTRANKRLSLLKHMAGSPFGATQQTLLHYYKACIRPILEYGSLALLIACPSALKRLESFQNAALRIALRLPKHARTSLVLTEAGCSSIEDRAKSLSMVSLSKFKANGNSHPYVLKTKDMHIEAHITGSQGRSVPLGIAMHNVAEDCSLPHVELITLPSRHPRLGPLSASIKTDIKPLAKSKSLMTPSELLEVRDQVNSHINQVYSLHTQFYIDGSVDPDSGRAAAGIMSNSASNSVAVALRLTDGISSTQAELGAIHEALCYITGFSSDHKVVIHCDSLSAIQAIKRPTPDIYNKQVYEIVKLAAQLVTSKGIELTLHWIPSHVGIEGNELVDALVKTGLEHAEVEKYIPPTIGQVKSNLKKYFKAKTKIQFEEKCSSMSSVTTSQSYQRYMEINPSLTAPQPVTRCPTAQRTINRLRVDSDSWCYQHMTNNECCYCGLIFSIHHFLIECPRTQSNRFLELLTQEEHQLYPRAQAQIILNRLTSPKEFLKVEKHLKKFPLKVSCPSPDHGDLYYEFINIPKGL